MAEPVKTTFENARLDAKTLEKFVNGSDVENASPRLTTPYPTIKKAIKELFENGGLPATPFIDYDSMVASDLIEGALAIVLFGDKNGLYRKSDTDWVEVDYSHDYKEVVNKLDAIEQYIRFSSDTNKLFTFVDDNDVAVFEVDTQGNILVQNLDKSVQAEIAALKNNINDISGVSNAVNAIPAEHYDSLFTVVDAAGLIVLDIKKDGRIVSAATDYELTSKINDIDFRLRNKPDANNIGYCKDIYSEYPIHSAVATTLAAARVKYGSPSPIPKNMLASTYAIGTAWIDNVSVDLSGANKLIKLKGVDYALRDGIGAVHPYAVEFAGKVAGYKYWMAITGYTQSDDRTENAFIYGSNDPELRDWKLIDGFPQPFLDTPPEGLLGSTNDGQLHSHHSDVGICYDPTTGDIVLYWRVSLYYKVGSYYKQGVYGSRYDGKGWSDPYFIYEPVNIDGGDPLLSPAIIYNHIDSLFYMYYVSNDNKIWYKTSATLLGANWSERQLLAINNVARFWHIEAKWVGDSIVLLIHSDDGMAGTGIDSLFFATSKDGINFNVSANNIVTSPSSGFYKASFMPVVDKNNLLSSNFHVFYTTDGGTEPMFQLGIAQTNTINLGA